MKPLLDSGLHIAIVINPHPGQGGSLLALETYFTCRHFGIPAILATFDSLRPYPDLGPDLRRLPVPGIGEDRPLTPAERGCLVPISEEARDQNKMLIIDTRCGFSDSDPMFEILSAAGIGHADSVAALVAALVAARNGEWGSGSIESLYRPFAAVGAKFDRGIVRTWGFSSDLAGISAPTGHPNLHLWAPPFLQARHLEQLHAEPVILEGPADPRLLEAVEDLGDLVLMADGEDDDHLSRYRRLAREAIWMGILKPITLTGQVMPEADDFP